MNQDQNKAKKMSTAATPKKTSRSTFNSATMMRKKTTRNNFALPNPGALLSFRILHSHFFLWVSFASHMTDEAEEG